MQKPPFVRECQERDGIFVFDEFPDERLSTYRASHLEDLAQAEASCFWFAARSERICSFFNQYVPKNSRILEVGTGTGYVAERLHKLGFLIEASDCAKTGLLHAKKRGLTKLYQFDLFHPPFFEAFDVICLFDVLEHVKDDKTALIALMRMLKPGGMLILTAPAHRWLWCQDDFVAGHERRYSRKDLEHLFEFCSLQPICIRYFFMMLLPFLMARKWLRRNSKNFLGSRITQERVNLNLPRPLNGLLRQLCQLESRIDRFLPNIAGGSLLAAACKKH